MPMCGILRSVLAAPVRKTISSPHWLTCWSLPVVSLVNPRDQATHVGGAALDLVFVSIDCPSTLRIHDGVSCCHQAPGCCPIMGSNHRLCVLSTELVHRSPSVARSIPPLRDWSSTLLRAHMELWEWSCEVSGHLHGLPPRNEARRVDVMDGLYQKLLAILARHVPHHRCLPRRSQPSWWTPECHAACVSRNGAWRDHLRAQSPGSLARFRVARTAFHRTVRTFDDEFFQFVSSRFSAMAAAPAYPAPFDASFSPPELRHALAQCVDSAVGLDGLPYSLFKTNFRWWQEAVLSFLNLSLFWGVVPSHWKHSIVVPVFKRGDPSVPHNYRPISLASCFFKLLERLILSRISPHISPQLDEPQGGFRWGADLLVGSLVSLLSSRPSSHTFVAFIDIRKAFDTSWVEGTLVRLFDAGVQGRMWRLMCHFLRGTRSQVRLGSSLSHPWTDSGIAQGRALSPLLFNLLVNGLIAAVRRAAPGVQLFSSPERSPGQLYADDLELAAESQHDLQVALDAVSDWGRKWRFTFGIGPTKSAVMVFGPRRTVPPCSALLAGSLLPVVSEYPYLGVILTPLSRGFPMQGTWCRAGTASSPSVSRGSRPNVSP